MPLTDFFTVQQVRLSLCISHLCLMFLDDLKTMYIIPRDPKPEPASEPSSPVSDDLANKTHEELLAIIREVSHLQVDELVKLIRH
jgi:hypothetical protein